MRTKPFTHYIHILKLEYIALISKLTIFAKRYLPSFIWRPMRWLYRILNGIPPTGRIIERHRQKLVDILESCSPSGPIVIFPPSLDWDVQLFQRPQQLALALARQGALVFYMQPKPDLHKEPFQLFRERIFLCNTVTQTFEGIDNSYVYVLTWNGGYARVLKSPKVIYDFVDDIDVFYGDKEEIAQNHAWLLENAHYVIVTAERLYNQVVTKRRDAIFCPNGVEYEHFEKARVSLSSSPPEDLEPILGQGKPVIGYYGALARWFDYDLFEEVARLRPGYSFLLLGPDYDGTFQKERWTSLPNVYWLGVKKYIELPAYLHYFDVATIPFILNDITHATSPLKLFEYLAGGKPVVVTPMHESMRYRGVLVGATPDEFAVRIDEALQLKNDPQYLALIDKVSRENTWDARASLILESLNHTSFKSPNQLPTL